MIKVAITGVQGSGKTTIVKQIVAELSNYGKAIMFEEPARKCNSPINTETTIKSQEFIWNEHVLSELRSIQKNPDYLICDRTLMDNLVYYKRMLITKGIQSESFDSKYLLTVPYMKTYDIIIRLPLNKERILNADDNIRDKDIKFAVEIDRLFDDMVQPYVTTNVTDFSSIMREIFLAKSILEMISEDNVSGEIKCNQI